MGGCSSRCAKWLLRVTWASQPILISCVSILWQPISMGVNCGPKHGGVDLPTPPFRSLQRGTGSRDPSKDGASFRSTENSFGRRFARPVFAIGGLNNKDEIRVFGTKTGICRETDRLASRVVGNELSHAKAARSSGVRSTGIRPATRFKRPGLHAQVGFDVTTDICGPYIASGIRPKIAVLREQGVNGHVEMAAAFDRAGFAAIDVHMSDIIAGRVSLEGYQGFAACGGFSYGDVLGAGRGWAKSILFNARARSEFEAFFQRTDTFALGVCNGCQMMSWLHEIIPGAEHWPRFVRNKSEQFEARFVMVEVPQTPSLYFDGMAGSRIPVSVAHGEGRAEFLGRMGLKRLRPGCPAFRGQPGRGDRTLSVQPQRLARRHCRPDHAGWSLQYFYASPRARVSRSAALVAPRMG